MKQGKVEKVMKPKSVKSLPFFAGLALIAAFIASRDARAEDLGAWLIKSGFRVENTTKTERVLKQLSDLPQLQAQLGDENKITEILNSITATIGRVSAMDNRELTLEAIRGSVQLTKAINDIQKSMPTLGVAMNFVVYPDNGEAPDPEETLNDEAFSRNVLSNMNRVQEKNFVDFRQWLRGRKAEGPETETALYLLGITANARLAHETGETQLQLVFGMPARKIPGDPELSIPWAAAPELAPVMIIDVVQPLRDSYPTIELRFGQLGHLRHTDWRYRFDARTSRAVELCSRAQSVPTINTWKFHVIPVSIPLYYAKFDLNQKKVVDADVKLNRMLCVDPGGLIQKQFMLEANQKVEALMAAFQKLLGASPAEYLELTREARSAFGLP